MGRLLRRVGAFLVSKHTAVTLILSLAVLTLIGTVVEQAPDAVRDDPGALAAWVDLVGPRYRGWTPLLAATGMFQVFHSPLFVAVSALLALSTLASVTRRVPQLWRRTTRPPGADGVALERLAVGEPVEDVFDRVEGVMRRRRYRVVRSGDHLAADRFRFAPLGTALSHLGFVLVMAGVAVTALAGFRDQALAVTLGETVSVGHGTGLVVEATDVRAVGAGAGQTDYASDVVLRDATGEVARATVRVNRPLRTRGLSFYQAYVGTSAQLLVTDAAGRELFAGSVPMQWASADGRHTLGRFAVAEQGLTVHVVTSASGTVDPEIGPGQVRLQVMRNGSVEPVATQVVSAGGPANLDGLVYTFLRERQFTGLSVARDPGKPWVWAGALLLVGGMCGSLFVRYRRVAVRVVSGSVVSGDVVSGGDGAPVVELVADPARDAAVAALLTELRRAVLAGAPEADLIRK